MALGAASSGPIAIDRIQRWLAGGFFAGSNATLRTENKVTNMLGTRCDWDAPAISDSAVATGFNVTSGACTLTGAATGDPCFTSWPVSLILNDDAGTNISAATPTCFVSATNAVKIRLIPSAKQDGGAGPAGFDAQDAGYFVRVISSQ